MSVSGEPVVLFIIATGSPVAGQWEPYRPMSTIARFLRRCAPTRLSRSGRFALDPAAGGRRAPAVPASWTRSGVRHATWTASLRHRNATGRPCQRSWMRSSPSQGICGSSTRARWSGDVARTPAKPSTRACHTDAWRPVAHRLPPYCRHRRGRCRRSLEVGTGFSEATGTASTAAWIHGTARCRGRCGHVVVEVGLERALGHRLWHQVVRHQDIGCFTICDAATPAEPSTIGAVWVRPSRARARAGRSRRTGRGDRPARRSRTRAGGEVTPASASAGSSASPRRSTSSAARSRFTAPCGW